MTTNNTNPRIDELDELTEFVPEDWLVAYDVNEPVVDNATKKVRGSAVASSTTVDRDARTLAQEAKTTADNVEAGLEVEVTARQTDDTSLGQRIDGLDSSKANSDHTHTESDITDLAIPEAATEIPEKSGTSGAVGTSDKYAREDHRHEGDGGGGGGGDVTKDQLDAEIKARTSGDDLQSIVISSASSYQSDLNAQLASDQPLEIVIGQDISGTRGGSPYSYKAGDVLYVAPRSDSPETRFNIAPSDASGITSGQAATLIRSYTGQTTPDGKFAVDRIPNLPNLTAGSIAISPSSIAHYTDLDGDYTFAAEDLDATALAAANVDQYEIWVKDESVHTASWTPTADFTASFNISTSEETQTGLTSSDVLVPVRLVFRSGGSFVALINTWLAIGVPEYVYVGDNIHPQTIGRAADLLPFLAAQETRAEASIVHFTIDVSENYKGVRHTYKANDYAWFAPMSVDGQVFANVPPQEELTDSQKAALMQVRFDTAVVQLANFPTRFRIRYSSHDILGSSVWASLNLAGQTTAPRQQLTSSGIADLDLSTDQRTAITDNLAATASWVDGSINLYDAATSGNLLATIRTGVGLDRIGSGGEGLDQAQVDARVKAGVLDWAETGNTDAIPAAKLANALSMPERVGLMSMDISPDSIPDRTATTIAREYILSVTGSNVISGDNWYEIHSHGIKITTSRQRWVSSPSLQQIRFTIDTTQAGAISAAIARLHDMTIEVRFFGQASGGSAYATRVETVGILSGTQGLNESQVDERIQTQQTVLFSDAPIEPTNANAGKLLYRGNRLYTNELIAKTVTFRDITLTDIRSVWPAATAWGGVITGFPSLAAGTWVYRADVNQWARSAGGGGFETATTPGSLAAHWPSDNSHRVADEQHAINAAASNGQWFSWGSVMRVVTAVGAATHREWVEYERADVQTIVPTAANVSINYDLGGTVALTMNRNVTLAITGGYDGAVLIVRATQDATGSRTLTYGTALDISTTANTTDAVAFYRLGTRWIPFGVPIKGL